MTQQPTTQPRRIQRRRQKNWRAVDHCTNPNGYAYVGRGTRWGNPCTQIRMPALDGSEWEHEGRLGKTSGERHAFVHPDKTITWHLVKDATREQATELYRRYLQQRPALVEAARTELAGRDLMCWCPLPEPGEPDHCHASVLLLAANDYGAPAGAGVCDRCWQWEANPDRHPRCAHCGRPWDRSPAARPAAPTT